MLVVAIVIAAGIIIIHVMSTWSLQSYIKESHYNLDQLGQVLRLLYDYIPRAFIREIEQNNSEVLTGNFHDTAVMALDVTNISDLVSSMDMVEFCDRLTQFYE